MFAGLVTDTLQASTLCLADTNTASAASDSSDGYFNECDERNDMQQSPDERYHVHLSDDLDVQEGSGWALDMVLRS